MQITVAQYLLTRLKSLGVDHVFGIPGDFILPLFETMVDFVSLSKQPKLSQKIIESFFSYEILSWTQAIKWGKISWKLIRLDGITWIRYRMFRTFWMSQSRQCKNIKKTCWKTDFMLGESSTIKFWIKYVCFKIHLDYTDKW